MSSRTSASHPAAATRLEVDLGAIVANWRLLTARHAPGAVAAVVKADAYGLGARPIARALYAAGCRHFFTAHLDEALALRAGLGSDALLAVLNGLLPGDAATYREQNITPVLNSLGEIALWHAEAVRSGEPLGAIVQIDTGMTRLGLDAPDVARLAAEPALLGGITLRYVMTHLVAAELPEDPLNETQLTRFEEAAAQLPPAPRSLANSSGIFLGPRFRSDLARPGAALYGINPTPGRPNPMRGVLRLTARVLAVHVIAPEASVGYDATWHAAHPARIATIGVGYADGWFRSLSNHGVGVFDARPLPLVGRVSMDLTTFDASDHPKLHVGDWIELIGPHQPLERVAAAAGTSAYEVLTNLGARYPRVLVGA